jgi:hypothetical protein
MDFFRIPYSSMNRDNRDFFKKIGIDCSPYQSQYESWIKQNEDSIPLIPDLELELQKIYNDYEKKCKDYEADFQIKKNELTLKYEKELQNLHKSRHDVHNDFVNKNMKQERLIISNHKIQNDKLIKNFETKMSNTKIKRTKELLQKQFDKNIDDTQQSQQNELIELNLIFKENLHKLRNETQKIISEMKDMHNNNLKQLENNYKTNKESMFVEYEKNKQYLIDQYPIIKHNLLEEGERIKNIIANTTIEKFIELQVIKHIELLCNKIDSLEKKIIKLNNKQFKNSIEGTTIDFESEISPLINTKIDELIYQNNLSQIIKPLL